MPSGWSGAIAMLDDRTRAAIVDAVDADAAVGWLRTAVRTPSVTGNETAFAALVASELEACGAGEVHVEHVAAGRPIVWSVTRGVGGGQTAMLAGHLDTVRADGWAERWHGTEREDPFGAAIVDGAVWGRGSGDLKGGIATALAALRTLQRAETSLRGDVVTLWVCDEESGEPGLGRSLGMRAAVERVATNAIPRADFAVYLEPTQLAIYCAQIGFLIAEIALEGRSAYFGRPEEGVDALRAGHAVLTALWELDAELRARTAHPLLGPPGLLVTEAHAGGYIAVPGSSALTLIRTLTPSEDLADAAAEIEGVVRRALEGTGVRPAVSFPAGRDHRVGGLPAETEPEAPAVRLLVDAVRAVAPDCGAIDGAPYWSEMSYLQAAGVPCVYWAPGDIRNCHTSEEHVEVDELLDGVRALSLFLADYCGVGRTRGGGS
jgi:acetylornithine deacetylase